MPSPFSSRHGPGQTFQPQQTDRRYGHARIVQRAIEIVVILLVCAAPWAFGSIDAVFHSILFGGVSLLLFLWATLAFLGRGYSLRLDAVSVALLVLLILGAGQLVPLPPRLLDVISPETDQLMSQLLPDASETLADGSLLPGTQMAAGGRISMYPWVTASKVLSLLAAVSLFFVVRNTIASADSFRRLAVAVVANGTLLAYCGIAQTLRSSNTLIYSIFPTPGESFGPFVNRNQFAFHNNLCIGLGFGLLLAIVKVHQRRSTTIRALLRSYPVLLSACALVFMLAAQFMCVSRGGLLATIAGVSVVAIWILSGTQKAKAFHFVPYLIVLAVALVSWLGFDFLQSRYSTVFELDALERSRIDMWRYTMPLVERFGAWGTGLGTFPYVEPLVRPRGVSHETFVNYAHNDYLQVLIEAGAVGFLATAFLAFSLIWTTTGALKRQTSIPTHGLVVGILFGLTTSAVHSFFDSGTMVPSIVFLAVVLLAQVSCLAAADRIEGNDEVAPAAEKTLVGSRDHRRSSRFGSVASSLALMLIAVTLYVHARRIDLSARHVLAADRASNEDVDVIIHHLTGAIRFAPHDARLHIDLGEAYSHLATKNHTNDSIKSSLVAAQTHFLQARSLCPLFPQPHAWLFSHWTTLAKSDPRESYLRRALTVRPTNPNMWHAAGLFYWEKNRVEDAIRAWHRALELSPSFLEPILAEVSSEAVSTDTLVSLFPDDPSLIQKAADYLYPVGQSTDARRDALLRHALDQLEGRSEELSADDNIWMARLNAEIGDVEDAIESYDEALRMSYENWGWRYEYAEFLRRRGRLREARRQLLTILRAEPSHRRASRLLDVVRREFVDRELGNVQRVRSD